MIDLATIDRLAPDTGVIDVACPICGPERRSPINRRRKVLRVWRLESSFATYHCARCGARGHVRDDYSKPQIDRTEFERRLAAARAEAVERERSSAAERLSKALWLWKGRKPIAGSIAETYLRQARGYHGTIPATLGYLAPRGQHGPAIIAAFGMAYEPEPGLVEIADIAVRGVHITRLASDGLGKAGTERDKIMLGSSIGYPIVLAPANDLFGLAIVEGIEDALSLHQATGLGAWAAGAAGRLPALAEMVPRSIESVTIFAHDDRAGMHGARTLADKLTQRGSIEVRFTSPRGEYRGCALHVDGSFREVA
jgi:hypothetical protein